MAIDPRSGAAVFARYALIPARPTEKMLPPRPPLRLLKCVRRGLSCPRGRRADAGLRGVTGRRSNEADSQNGQDDLAATDRPFPKDSSLATPATNGPRCRCMEKAIRRRLQPRPQDAIGARHPRVELGPADRRTVGGVGKG